MIWSAPFLLLAAKASNVMMVHRFGDDSTCSGDAMKVDMIEFDMCIEGEMNNGMQMWYQFSGDCASRTVHTFAQDPKEEGCTGQGMDVTDHVPKLGECAMGATGKYEKHMCKAYDGPSCKECMMDFIQNDGCAWWKNCEEKDTEEACENPPFKNEMFAMQCTRDDNESCQKAVARKCGVVMNDSGSDSGSDDEGDDKVEACKMDGEGNVMKPMKDECVIDRKSVKCGKGFLTTQSFMGNDCTDAKGIATNCHYSSGTPCDAMEQAMNMHLQGQFKGFGNCNNIGGEGQDEFAISMKVFCEAGDEVDCDSEMGKGCQGCKGAMEMCKNAKCDENSIDEQCNICNSCKICAPFMKCDVDCDSEIAQGCKGCAMMVDECMAADCQKNPNQEICKTCQQCQMCKPYMGCNKDDVEVDCKSEKAGMCIKKCGECTKCIGVESEECSKCEQCNDCMPFAKCMMKPDCKSEKAIKCVKKCGGCAKCVGVDSEECSKCSECEVCTPFASCVKDGGDDDKKSCEDFNKKTACNDMTEKMMCKWKKKQCVKMPVKCKKLKSEEECAKAGDACKTKKKKNGKFVKCANNKK